MLRRNFLSLLLLAPIFPTIFQRKPKPNIITLEQPFECDEETAQKLRDGSLLEIDPDDYDFDRVWHVRPYSNKAAVFWPPGRSTPRYSALELHRMMKGGNLI
jgi:hypothetical protein